jgi:pimeloyl-ACP methyl ester carboxylesterase
MQCSTTGRAVTVAQLDRDGVEIFYQVTGTPSAKSPILLTHGYSATSEMWRPNLDALGETRQVIVWDMRGHGRSAAPDSPELYSAACPSKTCSTSSTRRT